MIKPLLAALLISACSATHETFPTNDAVQIEALKEYRDGKLTWSQYQAKLKDDQAAIDWANAQNHRK